MSHGVGFGKDGKMYGLLYPFGYVERPDWQIALYSTERGRKTGIRWVRELFGGGCPILKFELNLSAIKQEAVLEPFIPSDHSGQLDHVVNPQWKHKGDKRPTCKDN